MKGIALICIVLLALLSGMSTAALAADSSFSIGIKGWYNSWESAFSDGSSFDNGDALLLGPSVKFSTGSFFLGASYLATMGDYEGDNFFGPGDTLTQDRRDLDLVAGFMLHPRFGIFAGYKSISSSAKYDDGAGFTTNMWDLTIDGPALGMTGNIPLGESGWVLVGNLSYLMLSATYENDPAVAAFFSLPATESDDMTGTSIEVSAIYGISDNASVNIGWKAQTLTYDKWNGDEKFSGLTFGFDYRF